MQHKSNLGQSFCLKTAAEVSKDRLLITIDGDGQNNPNDIHTKGHILLKLKQYQDAIKWFDKALAVDPNHKYSIKDRQLAVDAAKLDK